MFSYLLLFLSTTLFICPKLASQTKKYLYAIIFTSSVFAYTLLGQFALILIFINHSKFPILLLSSILLILIIFLDKRTKIKYTNLKDLLKSELINFKNSLNYNRKYKAILITIILLICLITISSIGPINHPDSLDYHIGYPYQHWLRGKFFIDDGLHQALLGIGDYANLSFIQEKNEWLIRYLQIINLPVMGLFIINKTNKKFYWLVLLSSPLFIQWSTIGKPLFLGESALAISYLVWKENHDKFSKNLLIICIFSCISIKISSLIVIFPILIDILFQLFNKSKEVNLIYLLLNEIKDIFRNNLIIISILILCSILISRQIISDNFLYPLLTNIFNRNDLLIEQFSKGLSLYRRDVYFPINVFIPIKLSDISLAIGPSFLILIIIKFISIIKNKKIFKDVIFSTSIAQISLLLLFCQGRGDYYIAPIIIFLYSLKDIEFNHIISPLKYTLLFSISIQIVVIIVFLGFSIKQTILTLNDYEKTMSLTSYGYSSKKYIDTNIKGNLFYNVGRDVRFYYPSNYISRESMEKCLLNNEQNYCLENLNINQIISIENYIENKKDFNCEKSKVIKGSRNPFNRKEINLEICRRKLP